MPWMVVMAARYLAGPPRGQRPGTVGSTATRGPPLDCGMAAPPTARDVLEAADRIRGQVVRTPARRSARLSELTGSDVVLKFENLQASGSFKDRGALNRLLAVDPASSAGVVAMSAGNHAQGVALHAARLGLKATIVMPEGTPFTKIARTRAHGAEVVVSGDSVGAAAAVARRLAAERNLELIHPFDDPLVIAGQGTVTAELLEDHPDVEFVIVPVGGGGLAAGATLAASLHDRDVQIVGVQSERYPAMADLLRNRRRTVDAGPTIADGIAVKSPGAITSSILGDHRVPVFTVSEAGIEQALVMLLEVEKTVTEGAGAVALAAISEQQPRFRHRRVGLILSGGNIDPRTLSVVALRGLATQGRLARLRVEVDDQPGRLAELTMALADARVNIVEVAHQRLGSSGARSTRIEFLLDTLDEAHIAAAIETLEQGHHHVTRLEV